jgi:hypothetical protein
VAASARSVAESVVEQFLSRRHADSSKPASTSGCGAGGCGPSPDAPRPADVSIVEFVCEADVREAMRQSRKIYIGPKTIVTPVARDLASANDILVLAQR